MQITKEQIMDLKKRIIDYVKDKGPVIPIHLSKETGCTTIFAGAILSEMIAQKLVKVTSAKIGSSPLYYCPGQEGKIISLREYLSQRPKQAFDLIKEHKILHDRSCEPWQRVALREIKDFAMPIYIQINGEQEIFWRWYLLPEEDAVKEIKNVLEQEEKKQDPKTELPIIEEKKEEIQKELETIKKEIIEVPALEKSKPKRKKEKKDSDKFYKDILKMFSDKKIEIVEQKILKPGKEFNFMINVPSNVGIISFLAIARDKKKVNDADITMAFSEGLNLKMPVMYLSQGELNKKAAKYLETQMKGVLFKKI